MDLDDVHGCHGQASTIDHAPNAALKANVIEICFACCHLPASTGAVRGKALV